MVGALPASGRVSKRLSGGAEGGAEFQPGVFVVALPD